MAPRYGQIFKAESRREIKGSGRVIYLGGPAAGRRTLYKRPSVAIIGAASPYSLGLSTVML